jgi:hypothetical protein
MQSFRLVRRTTARLALLLPILVALSAPAARSAVIAAPRPADTSVLFVQNTGQADPIAHFMAVGAGATLLATDSGIWLRVRLSKEQPEHSAATIRLGFDGANPHPRIEAFNPLQARVSYLVGARPTWRTDLPAWGGIRYVDIYPKIDWELAGHHSRLVQRIVAHPGANLSAVRLRVAGTNQIALASDALQLSTAAGELSLPLPELMSATTPAKQATPHLAGDGIAWPFASAASAPAASAGASNLAYAIALGGTGDDNSSGIAVDSAGAAYITGYTTSASFTPAPGTADKLDTDAFVAKLTPSGALAFASFIGGHGNDKSYAIAIDSAGAAYITGSTTSTDFPTSPGAYNSSLSVDPCDGAEPDAPVPCSDAFVAKLSPNGSGLSFATLLGGIGNDRGQAIALSAGGDVYIAGSTSGGIPATPGAYESTPGGGICPGIVVPFPCNDGFAAHLNSTGSALLYSTFIGGQFEDWATAIGVDPNGAAYIAGYTNSPNFSTTPGAYDRALPEATCVVSLGFSYPCYEGFAVKLNPSGTSAAYATLLGGQLDDQISAIAVDAVGAAYVTGQTSSDDFPTSPGAFDRVMNRPASCDPSSYLSLECIDGFVAKIAPSGGALVYATLLGGQLRDVATSIAIDGAGEAFVAGETRSPDFPVTPGAQRTALLNQLTDAFVARLDARGSALAYASLVGGLGDDRNGRVAIDSAGNAYLTATVNGFILGDEPKPPYGFLDAFVVKLSTPPFIYRATALVPPGGGSLATVLDTTAYSFPAGTFASAASVTHTALLARDTPPSWPLLNIGYSFENTATLTLSGQPAQPIQPYSIAVHYANDGGAIESTLALYRWSSGEWVKEPSSLANSATNTVSATLSQFGRWAVLGETNRHFLPLTWRNFTP